MYALWTDWLGYTAAALTTFSFVPQAWHTFRSRDVSGISLAMYSAFTLGIALWLVYGVVIEAWPMIVANVVTLGLALCILGMKLRLGDRPGSP
ncbi:MAG TPA: SemiSWEET transporter [Albitalea sp.]|jgi:MtN3 and saliva related transmembrane protein|nr:SemiSWEET transporter [Albitalea sp.]